MSSGNSISDEENLRIWKNILNEKPEEDVVWFQVGVYSFFLGLLDEAEIHFKQAVKMNPKQFLYLSNLASTYFLLEKYHEAIDCFERIIDIIPFLDSIWFSLSSCYRETNNPQKSKKCLYKTLELNPSHTHALFNLGCTYTRESDFSKAKHFYLLAIDSDSTFQKAWINLGLTYTETNELHEALKCFQKAVSLDSSDYLAWLSLGLAHKDLNDDTQALMCWVESIKCNPNYAKTYYLIAKLQARYKITKRLFDFLRKAFELDQDYKQLALDNPIFDFIKDTKEFHGLF